VSQIDEPLRSTLGGGNFNIAPGMSLALALGVGNLWVATPIARRARPTSRMPVDMWTIGFADRLRLRSHPHRDNRQPQD
jgi:hypothetical protein